MKLAYQQLENHLAKTLAPIYILTGDETLLLNEARESILSAANKQGFLDKTRIQTDTVSDWGEVFFSNAYGLSLLAPKRIIELDLRESKLHQKNTIYLKEFAEKNPADTILLLLLNKLDKKTEQTSWIQALEKTGCLITFWPIARAALPQWIIERAKRHSISLTNEMAHLLAENSEGNLFAAAQEIEKLALLNIPITMDILKKTLSDNSHFNIFDLVESTINKNLSRALNILKNLQAEECEPTLILWAFTRELRMLVDLLNQSQNGTPLFSLFKKYHIFEKRQPTIQAFLKRSSKEICWQSLLQAAKIDRIIKGAEQGDPWEKFEQLILLLNGNGILQE